MLPDEKAFFSNERTYLHWIKFGLLIGSTALTLLSFAEAAGYRVGLCLVTVAMSTLAYSTAMFHLRHRWMIQLRRDVKYYDRFGPTVLFMALFLAYATNVASMFFFFFFFFFLFKTS
ncbi:vacuolar transporter chaperone 1 [Lobosporangium transversale]|uniref:Vacuolar transporter chaperone 1 n=1 Tax=Lobosporangium transversale TaxID=64571 RepID=A0A1Y2G1A5_9FUNG|nr:vacuolar transporter chaperone 1 [Lobosporangium transversale]ORY89579.1 vacuolar transporter chaperone 1 [Lobosporangium transversale]|eukprot:XP_021875068.1 vacuolar transporter chaperone 1 [Lobosporangium transversale]